MRRLAVPCAILVAATGCGGGDGGDATRSAAVDAGETLAVEAREYSFDPDRVVVGGPGPLTIELANEGDLAHNLRLSRDGEEVGGTPSLPDGRTGSARVRLARGTYEMLCTVGDHAELGMTGELEVR
jgi:plastocyanin